VATHFGSEWSRRLNARYSESPRNAQRWTVSPSFEIPRTGGTSRTVVFLFLKLDRFLLVGSSLTKGLVFGTKQSRPTSIKSPAPPAIGGSRSATRLRCTVRAGSTRFGSFVVTGTCVQQVEEEVLPAAAQPVPVLLLLPRRGNHRPPPRP
jgi:hypothetical protein